MKKSFGKFQEVRAFMWCSRLSKSLVKMEGFDVQDLKYELKSIPKLALVGEIEVLELRFGSEGSEATLEENENERPRLDFGSMISTSFSIVPLS